MSSRHPPKDDDEEEPSQPTTKETPDKTDASEKTEPEPSETLDEEPPSSLAGKDVEQVAQTGRIIILEEREIPFEEERPPNFSPNFKIRLYRVRSRGRSREEKE